MWRSNNHNYWSDKYNFSAEDLQLICRRIPTKSRINPTSGRKNPTWSEKYNSSRKNTTFRLSENKAMLVSALSNVRKVKRSLTSVGYLQHPVEDSQHPVGKTQHYVLLTQKNAKTFGGFKNIVYLCPRYKQMLNLSV